MMSHLGSRVSALLDGRLAPEEEERCWVHVQSCHACRDLVEQEGRVKTQLARLSMGGSTCSRDLKSSLLGSCSTLAPQPFPTSGPRSRRGLVAIGGGAASACVVGVLALGVAGAPRIEPRPPATDLSRPAGPVAPATTTDDRSARTPVSPSRTPLAERLVAIREKIAP
ncbi:zf-HC2 domain-containing protein [Microbacterium sp. ARD31]|uniref:anti-sigma factor family protein n=1 Tax=Microbacterium sp. ARD31 TaxID=2962576 RepID=UPI002881A09D|nr:zf-HC2 domain-containing protein [Microbacterium sp. ARD31]MDT0184282.1 zf-HC2 domain-containing protein [Microbacterium sp. ARD31]